MTLFTCRNIDTEKAQAEVVGYKVELKRRAVQNTFALICKESNKLDRFRPYNPVEIKAHIKDCNLCRVLIINQLNNTIQKTNVILNHQLKLL